MAEEVYSILKGAVIEAVDYWTEDDSAAKNTSVGVHPKKFYRSVQQDGFSCGAHSVYMILRHFGRDVSYKDTVKRLGTNHDGTNVIPIITTLRYFDLRVGYYPRLRYRRLQRLLSLDAICVVHLDRSHFGVVHGTTAQRVFLADPSYKKMKDRRSLSVDRFKKRWNNWAISARP